MFLSLFSVGEGSFGRVLQAKAEGIVPGMPDRNVVAVKTTKGTRVKKFHKNVEGCRDGSVLKA